MQVTKLTANAGSTVPEKMQLSEKQLYDSINYHRAGELTKKMMEKGFITDDECDKILAESRKIFVPLLADLFE